MKKHLFTAVFSLVISSNLCFGQSISVTNTQTATSLVQNVLLGFGVTATNISVNGVGFSGNNVYSNIARFTAAGTSFPISSGVVLTTGRAIAAVGPNSSGSFSNNTPPTASVANDPHLNAIIPGTTPLPTNGVVLEFDFVPAGDTISFKYMFGSEEYPEFANSSFNDAFGFFLWGPGISGPYTLAGYPNGGVNIATIPNSTTPVTINSVNPTQNSAYYVNNLGGAAYGGAIQYDGTTTLLTANASVICGNTYHIKLAICNVSDQAWDSGVFLQANSFSSEAIQVDVSPSIESDTSVYEGCSSASISFIRPENQIDNPLTISYSVTGTATPIVDYNPLPNPLTFLPGEDTITLTITPVQDNISDNNEYINIVVTTVSECGDTIISTGTLYIIDEIPIAITETDPYVKCVNDSVLVTASAVGKFPPLTYAWQGGQTGQTAFFPTVQNAMTGDTSFIVTVTNSCGYSAVDTVTISLNQTLKIDTILMGPATCEPIGWVSATSSGETTTPQHGIYYQWTTQSGISGPASTVWENLSSGWYILTVEDAVCSVKDSVFVEMTPPPIAQFDATPEIGCSPLDVVFTNTSQHATSYQWNFGNGSVATVTNLNPQNQTYTTSAIVQLIAIQSPNCKDTVTASITIAVCGCTDPEATNYNPLAAINDGSCIYPNPSVIAPNVFSPNGDGSNDTFFLNTKFAKSVQLTIINRWSNVVFSGEGANPYWDGKVNGTDASDGVYFYTYVVKGVTGETLEGNGFLTLER